MLGIIISPVMDTVILLFLLRHTVRAETAEANDWQHGKRCTQCHCAGISQNLGKALKPL